MESIQWRYSHKNRMEIFTQKIVNKFIKNLINNSDLELDEKVVINGKQYKEVIAHWRKFPYYRLTNVLIDLRILPNQAGMWYYTSEMGWASKNNVVKSNALWKFLFK